MTGMKRKRHPLGRYYRIPQQPMQIVVDREVHALLAAYARKHNYTLREAANKAIAGGLALDLMQEDARKKRKEVEELLK
jgi:hypothetical protein